MKYMLITGANSGIGFQTLLKCFKKNITPIGSCRNIQELEKNLCDLDISRERFHLVDLDLCSEESVQELVPRIKGITKKLDHIVLNAGYIKTSPALMTSKDIILKHMNINFVSQISIAQAMTKSFFIKQRSGTIVAISSSAAIDANEGRMAYASSKAAFSTAIRVLSKELGKINIRANVIAPGLTDTRLMRDSTEANQIEKVLEQLSLKRLGNPEEIADLIHFLSSDESSFITGQVVSIDGGIR